MAIVEELVALLGYEVKGKEALKDFKEGLDDTEKSAGKLAGSLAGGGARAALVGGAIATGMVAAGTAAIAASKKWSTMEERVTSWANTTNQSVASMTARYMKLADDAWKVGVPLEKAADAYEKLLAQGMDPDEALKFLPDLEKYVRASGAAADDAAGMYANLASQYGLAGDKAKRFFEIVYAGANFGNFENKDFARYGPMIASGGGELFPKNENGFRAVVALAETIAQGAPNAEAANTAITNLLGKLNSKSTWEGSKTRDGLEKILGISFDDVKSGKVGWGQLAELFNKNRDRLPEAFPDREAQRGAMWLANSVLPGQRTYSEAYAATSAEAASGSVEQGWARKADSTNQAFQNMGIAADRLGNALGMLSSGPVREGANLIATAANGLATAAETLYNILPQNGDKYDAAVQRGMEQSGIQGWLNRQWELMKVGGDQAAMDAYAKKGGYEWPEGKGPSTAQESWASRRFGGVVGGAIDWITGADQGAAAGAVVQDNSTNKGQQNITVSAPVTVNVQQAAEAPGAVGNAVSGAINGAAQNAPQPGRMQPGPVSP